MPVINSYDPITPTLDDVLLAVDDPGGTPATGLASVRDILLAGMPFFEFALSDETTDLTTGVKLTWRAPFAFTVLSVRASLVTASSSGVVTFDIHESGTTILSTKLTIDASEKTSVSAATPPVISDSAIASDAELTFEIDTEGTSAKGAKLKVFYNL